MNVKFETDATAGSLDDSASADILCDAYMAIDVDGTTYYLALYDTVHSA